MLPFNQGTLRIVSVHPGLEVNAGMHRSVRSGTHLARREKTVYIFHGGTAVLDNGVGF